MVAKSEGLEEYDCLPPFMTEWFDFLEREVSELVKSITVVTVKRITIMINSTTGSRLIEGRSIILSGSSSKASTFELIWLLFGILVERIESMLATDSGITIVLPHLHLIERPAQELAISEVLPQILHSK